MSIHRLFLDLASHDALIACVTDQKVTSSESVSARIPDHELLSIAETVLTKAGWKYADLTHIACVVGPGGFTSLRVAVTFANVLADQLGIPLAGIHLSELYGARAWGVGRGAWEDANFYWVHSTKKEQLFIRGGQWNEPTLIMADALPPTPYPQRPIQWMGELIPEHRTKIGSDPMLLKDIADVLPAFLAGQPYDKKSLHPWYGRGW